MALDANSTSSYSLLDMASRETHSIQTTVTNPTSEALSRGSSVSPTGILDSTSANHSSLDLIPSFQSSSMTVDEISSGLLAGSVSSLSLPTIQSIVTNDSLSHPSGSLSSPVFRSQDNDGEISPTVVNSSSSALINWAASSIIDMFDTTTVVEAFENVTTQGVAGLLGNATATDPNVTFLSSDGGNGNGLTTPLPTSFVTGLINGSSTEALEDSAAMADKERELNDFLTGLGLAVSSSVFIGSSFILKKLGLIRYAKKVSLRAGQGGLGYLREWMWWAGMILMTVGEFANFAAYAFAPATLVTPLGALSVIVSAVLSARVLKEKLNILGKIGCVLCVLGSTLMVIHSPKEQEVHDVEDLLIKMKEPGFIVYALCILVVCIVMMVYFSPRYGQKNVLIYITICSGLGSFTVMGCKGVGTAITATARGHNEFKNWLTYVLLAVVIVCILLQLNYLNKALDTFNTAVVTPIYYVFFTSFVIIGSAILFREFFKMAVLDIIGDLCGFLVIIIGIFLLNAFKDMRISLRNLPSASKETEEEENSEGTNAIVSLNGVNSSNYLVDCQDIEAEIKRNMAVEGITRDFSRDTEFSENGSHSLNVEPYHDHPSSQHM